LFFFQAEDGIRDLYVTGVQTCALPICVPVMTSAPTSTPIGICAASSSGEGTLQATPTVSAPISVAAASAPRTYGVRPLAAIPTRSEERRVGKECRYRWSP